MLPRCRWTWDSCPIQSKIEIESWHRKKIEFSEVYWIRTPKSIFLKEAATPEILWQEKNGWYCASINGKWNQDAEYKLPIKQRRRRSWKPFPSFRSTGSTLNSEILTQATSNTIRSVPTSFWRRTPGISIYFVDFIDFFPYCRLNGSYQIWREMCLCFEKIATAMVALSYNYVSNRTR